MIHALRFASVLIAGAGVCCACSGGGGGGGGGSPTMQAEPKPIVVSTTFPSGNAKPVGGGTAWDIVGVTTTLYGQFHYASGNAYDTLRVDVTFAQNVANALPAPGQAPSSPSQLGMTVQLDTGTNGFFETCSQVPGSTPFQFRSDDSNARLSDGNYSIDDESGPIYTGPSNPGSEAQTTVSGNVITQIFYLGTIGVNAGPAVPNIKIGVAAVNGTLAGATDCVPSGNGEIDANAM